MTKITALIALLVAALLMQSCGGASSAAGLDEQRLSASLDLGPSIGAEGARAALVPTAEAGTYTLSVENAQGAKALYGEVRYNPLSQHLTGMTPQSGSAADPALVLLVDDPANGRAQFGWVLPNFDVRPGLSGSIEIASLSLASGPARVNKQVLKAPTGTGNAFTIAGEVLSDGRPQLTWLEALQGDGDNNGEVNISDLTPLGISFKKSPSPTDPADSQERDADYDKNGEVNIADITPVGLNIGTTLGGYVILSGPDAASLTEGEEFSRTAMFPTKPNTTSGELTWVWAGPDPLTEDTTYKVRPYDATAAKTRGKDSDNTVTLIAPVQTTTVTDVTIKVPAASGLVTDSDGDYVVVLTEESVDGVDGNAQNIPGVVESLQLSADVDTAEDPGNIIDGTTIVQWRVIDGGGLANVGNGGISGTKGLMDFVDRGKVTIEAHANGNFAIKDTVSFKLYSIDSIDLVATPGGAGPVAVNGGAAVSFTATGNFDFDAGNTKEITRDITAFCNWGMLPGGANGGDFSFDTGVADLDTGGASSGDTVQVSAEFPATDDVHLFDNQKRASNLVTVNIN